MPKKQTRPITTNSKMWRYFDPTTTQPLMYAAKPYKFESMISPWSGKTVLYNPANWIQCRDGEEMVEIPGGQSYIPKREDDTKTFKKA